MWPQYLIQLYHLLHVYDWKNVDTIQKHQKHHETKRVMGIGLHQYTQRSEILVVDGKKSHKKYIEVLDDNLHVFFNH